MAANDMQAVTIHRPTKVATAQGEWTVDAIQALLDKPLMDLLFEAHESGVKAEKLMAVDEVLRAAQAAKDAGATRAYQDPLDTLQHVRSAGISVCCVGSVGMGGAPVHRAGPIAQLADLQPYPESVPINSLVQVPGTPLADSEPIDPFDFVRVIAVARITMAKARVRLPAGRQQMGGAVQALCFRAGASSIFYGDKSLVTGNPDVEADVQLLAKLRLNGHRTTTSTESHDPHAHAATAVSA